MKRVVSAALIALFLVSGLMWLNRQRLLVHAAARGETRILDSLLFLGADPGSKATGSTPLYAAVWHGKPEAAASLLAHGAEVDAADASGVTPLMAAARNGDDALVRLLLAYGADPAVRASCGTALDLAREGGHESTAAMIDEALGDRRSADLWIGD